jgi:L-alanine-DL-glutamate epimerase-like enolase superfamily enzyme
MKRRNFIKTSASGLIAANITNIACANSTSAADAKSGEYLHQGRIPEYKDHRIIDPGLKIKKIETFSKPEVAFVRVTTDDDMQGWGQISTYNSDISSLILHRDLANRVLGKDPASIDEIVDTCIESNLKYPWSYICRALGGVDTAIWDLYGKIKQKPVCELLGGTLKPFPVYGSSMSRSIKPQDELARFRKAIDEEGIMFFKFRIGTSNGRNKDDWEGRTEDMIKTIGKSLSDSCSLKADGNSCYTPDKAIEVGKLMQEYHIKQFEEPCPYWELEWTAEVAAALDLSISGGEQDNDLAQWRRMIAMNAVDIVQPDILYVGGFTRVLRVALMANEKIMPCIPHSANHCLVTVFTLHLMNAIPNAGNSLEYSIEFDEGINKLAKDIYSPLPEIRDGNLYMPPEPGWGIRINEEWLKSADYMVSEEKN